MKTIKLEITETGRNYLSQPPETFDVIEESFETIEQLKKYLVERYGKIPNGRKKIYTNRNSNSEVVGFLHSYWNQDCSHNSPKWYQTDWIEFWTEESTIKYNIKL